MLTALTRLTNLLRPAWWRPELVLSRQQAMLDLQAIQRIPGLAGYWPADPAYLYEDSAGTIPASVGGVVGKRLDVSAPATLGSELIVNGTMDNVTTPWSNGVMSPAGCTTRTLDAGRLKMVCTTTALSYSYLTQAFNTTLQLGGEYQFRAEIETTVPCKVSVYNAANFSNTIYSVLLPAGTHSVSSLLYLASTASLQIIVAFESGFGSNVVDGTMWLDNVSLKQVLGTKNAFQATTANKPYLRKTPTSGVYWLDSNTGISALTATLGNLGSACTVAQAGAEGVTFTEGVTISSTYNIAPAYGFNGDVAIFNRALTTTEKVLVTRYMARGVPIQDNNIANAINYDLAVWNAGGANTKSFGADGITITYGDKPSGYASLRASVDNSLTSNLIVGRYYLLKSRIKAVGTVSLRVQDGSGTSLSLSITIPTSFEDRTFGFTAVNAINSLLQFYSLDAGKSITIGPITLVPIL